MRSMTEAAGLGIDPVLLQKSQAMCLLGPVQEPRDREKPQQLHAATATYSVKNTFHFSAKFHVRNTVDGRFGSVT